MAILYKHPGLERQVRQAHRSVRMVLNAFVREAKQRYNKDVTVTSVNRPRKANAEFQSVHSTDPCRGIDIRVNGAYKGGKIFPGPYEVPTTLSIDEASEITVSINTRYVYDAARPQKTVAIYGYLDDGNEHWDHAHLQGHPGTRLAARAQPDIDMDNTLEMAEDYVEEPEERLSESPGRLWGLWARMATNDTARSVARRVGKGLSAVATAAVLSQLGVPAAVTVPAYLAIEKGANRAAETRTGESANFDWWSLICRLIKFIMKRKGGE